MHGGRGRGLVLSAAAALLLLTAGCTGEGDPDASPAPTAEPSPVTSTDTTTATTTTTTTDTFVPVAPKEPPPVPVAEQTSESAVEFLQWWFSALNFAELTGETATLEANSAAECVFCGGQIENIEMTYSEGNRVERVGDSTISNLKPSPVDLNGNVVVEFDGSTPEYRVIDKDGAVIGNAPGTPVRAYNAAVEWLEGKWRIRALAEKT